MPLNRAAIFALFIGLSGIALADPITFTYTTISDPNAVQAWGGTTVSGVNASGLVVGNYTDTNGLNQGFAYLNGTYTTISDPNATVSTYVTGVNDSGQIVGYYTYDVTTPTATGASETQVEQGFVYSNGTFTTISDPNEGTYGTWVTGINDAGQILGYYANSSGLFYGFVDSNGTFTSIADPNESLVSSTSDNGKASPLGTYPMSINDLGQIVGYYYVGYVGYGFEDTNGDFVTLSGPDGVDFEPTGISDSEIVGIDESSNASLGLLDTNGAFTVIDDPNTAAGGITIPASVNDSGVIGGSYTGSNGGQYGFVATPTTVAMPDGDPSPAWMIPGLLGVLIPVRFRPSRIQRTRHSRQWVGSVIRFASTSS